ncbi:MAG: PLP-dependent transferase [Gemmatimonadaceae bacterium]
MKIETLCVHAGHAPDLVTGAVAPPLHLSTTFERDADGEFRRGYIYSRDNNPTRAMLEQALAAVEGGKLAYAFSSGQAATHAVFQALRPGEHVIVPKFAYYGTPKLVREVFMPWGLQATFVDMRDLNAIRDAVRPNTSLIWVESPSNPLLTLTDIAAVVEIARTVKARVAVDNTWATPLGQRPLQLGADIVMHATTKYLSGHSDVLGARWCWVRRMTLPRAHPHAAEGGGGVAAPFDPGWWPGESARSRGACGPTPPMRPRSPSFFQRIRGWRRRTIRGFPHIRSTTWLADRCNFLRMASFQVVGGRAEALRVVAARTRIFTRATSLGGGRALSSTAPRRGRRLWRQRTPPHLHRSGEMRRT